MVSDLFLVQDQNEYINFNCDGCVTDAVWSNMHFLHTIEENESEELLQELEGGGRKESDEPSRHGIRKSRHETDSESYKATMAYTEKEPVSHEKRGDSNPSTGLASVAAKDQRQPHDEPSTSLGSSRLRNSRRSSSSTHTVSKRGSSAATSPNRRNSSTPQSLRRMSSSTPGSTRRRSSSARSSPSSSAPRVSFFPTTGPNMRAGERLLRTSQKTTSTKRTGGKAPSCRRRRRRRTHPAPEHDDLPAPRWLIDLMFDIEEASKHKLTVE
ncbi:hypothetical protein AMELA_G00059140 [Ameiurus melas]|uniref:Uncharacterized protein n=1 Tax=Ameiurus melas TaxID=219545 RepID=A0A7J6B124_AMEME|nr:hypothetical protein AMELA_G00059140 [Ameiurus melas]